MKKFKPFKAERGPKRLSLKYIKVIQKFQALLAHRVKNNQHFRSQTEMYREIEKLAFPHLAKYSDSNGNMYSPHQFNRVVEAALNLGWIHYQQKVNNRLEIMIAYDINDNAKRWNYDEYILWVNSGNSNYGMEVKSTEWAQQSKSYPIAKNDKKETLPQINNLNAKSDPAYTYQSTITSSMGFSGYSYSK
jgi:hypothetical protein